MQAVEVRTARIPIIHQTPLLILTPLLPFPPDLESLRLQTAVAKGRSLNVPRDTINGAIDRGINGKDVVNASVVRYDGTVKCGTATVCVVLMGLTDNKNRTSATVKAAFRKFGELLPTNKNAFAFREVSCVRVVLGGEDEEVSIGRGAKRRAGNVSVRNENHTRLYLHTKRTPSLTTAIILTHHPNPFRDSLRSSQTQERVMEAALEGGAEDVEFEIRGVEDGGGEEEEEEDRWMVATCYAPKTSLTDVVKSLRANPILEGCNVEPSMCLVPEVEVDVGEGTELGDFLEVMEVNEDITEVYHNAEG